MKKIISLTICLVLLAFLLTACAPKDNTQIRVGVLSGPTGMGMAKLMNDNKDNTEKYDFSIYNSPEVAKDDILGPNPDLDMLCLPTNVAATLAAKSGGALTVVAINCLGSLYLLTDAQTTISSIADLNGKTIYASVPTSTTGPILQYLLNQNGIQANIEFEPDHDALVARVAKGEVPIVVLPEPKVSAALTKAQGYSVDLNLSAEWDKVSDEPLTMGCIVARTAFLNEHKGAVDRFLDECENSIEYIGNKKNIDTAAQMIFDAGVLPSAGIAKSALTNLNGSIVYVDGDGMKDALISFYTAIGQALPDNSFYYDD